MPNKRGRASSCVSTYSLSETSSDEFIPNKLLSAPPYRLYDLAYAVVAFAAVNYLTGGRVPSLGTVLSQPSELLRSCGAALGAAAVVFAAFRSLPEVSHARLLHYEAELLKTVRGDVRHHWSRFQTKHASWHIHSLQLRSSAHAAQDANSSAGVGAASSTSGTASSSGPGRPQLVIIHGHSAGAAHWEAVLDRISAVADIHVLDMPGWGRSPAPEVLSRCASPSRCVDLVVEMAAGWMRANGLADVVLLGHSLGGFYAVQVAHRHPELVRQLLLVAPAGLTPMMPDGATLWGAYFKWMPPQRIARACGRLGYLLFRSIYLAFTVEDPRFPDFYYQLAAASRYAGKADRHNSGFLRVSTQGGALGLFWSHPCLSLLMGLDMPVSVIWGQRDEMLPPVLGALVHRIRPHTDMYYIAGALHNPAHNNAPAFCDAVADAIMKHAPGGDGRGLTLRPAAPGAVCDPAERSDGTADRLLSESALPCTFNTPESAAALTAADAPTQRPRLATARASSGEDRDVAGAPGVRAVGGPRATTAMTPVSTSTTLSSLPGSKSGGGGGAEPSHDRRRIGVASSGSSGGEGGGTHPHPSPSASTPSAASVHGWRNDWARGPGATGTPARLRMASSSLQTVQEQQQQGQGQGQLGQNPGEHAYEQPHDGVVAPVGRGRGYCHGCFHAVGLHKAYWRCGCGLAWTFNATVGAAATEAHFLATLAFLDELYVYGTFNALTSRTIVRRVHTRTPLPRPHPPAATAAMRALLQAERAGSAGELGATSGGDDSDDGGSNHSVPSSSGGPEHVPDGGAGLRRRRGGETSGRGGESDSGPGSATAAGGTLGAVVAAAGPPATRAPFPPAPGTIERGGAYLLS